MLDQAFAKTRLWREKPHVFVREVFGVTPDAWQDEALECFPHKPRIAMSACKGPGKSTVMSWLAWNFLVTRPHPKVAATSITADNLADGLWAEMAKWMHRAPMIQAAFEWTKTRISARDHPETWWMSARSWPRGGSAEQQANALAGLHEDYILFLIDESGGAPDAIMREAEGALSSCIEGHIVQAGNPTHLEGPLYRASMNRDVWHVIEINSDPDNPKRTPRVPVEWARQQIQQYGRDNPWVIANVFGRFPPSSINSLISIDECMEATRRSYRERDIEAHARIMGVDVAQFGDDASVMFKRQGLVAFEPRAWRNLDGIQGAGAVAREWTDWNADACFVDNTGGFGASWIDNLRLLGRQPIGVHYAGSPGDPRYYNKRAEMYFMGAEWIKGGGQLPNCTELVAAMTRTTYAFKGDKLILQPKAMVKELLGYSPDHADAFVQTFAQPVAPKARRRPGRVASAAPIEYNPFEEFDRGRAPMPTGVR